MEKTSKIIEEIPEEARAHVTLHGRLPARRTTLASRHPAIKELLIDSGWRLMSNGCTLHQPESLSELFLN
jgi:antitoxin (DNA-binding transcriptional repressor) of toxin-antitoxin stability system